MSQIDKETDRSSIEQQANFLKFLADNNLYQLITTENFPGLDSSKIALDRFWVTNKVINGFVNAASEAQHPQLRRRLSSYATQLIEQRDQQMFESLPEIDQTVDEWVLQRQAGFAQAAEPTRLLELAINFGMSDTITSDNFPALRGVSTSEMALVEARAVNNRVIILQDLIRSLSDRTMPQDHNLKLEISQIKSKLIEELSSVKQLLVDRLIEFTAIKD